MINIKQPNNIEEIREIIANRVIEFIRECNNNGIIMYLIIKTFPGSGKTTSVMKAIDKNGYNWIYLAPYHDIIRENLSFSRIRNYEFIHLKGRAQEGVCVAKEYKELAKVMSIYPFCETRCPKRHDGCIYYETRKRIETYPESWAGVHSHIAGYLQNFLFQIEYMGQQMFKHYDVIIVDEFPFQVLFNQVIVQRVDVDRLRDVVNRMDSTPEKDFVMSFLNELSLATGDIDVAYTKIVSIINNRRGLDLRTFLEEYDNELLHLFTVKEIEIPPKNMILFNIVEIHKQKPTKDKLKWMLYKHKWDGWSTPGIYMTTSNINKFKNLPIPVVALDSTAEITAWNALLNDKCLSEAIDMEYQNTYQMYTDARYPTSTWIESTVNNKSVLSESGIRLCELIREICKRKKNNVLLCCTKRIRGLIKEYLRKNYKRKNYKFAIYYNLRSRNEYYEDCDTCIITHEPNIPQIQIEIMKNVIGWDEELLRELMTKSEIKQAIGRIRQNLKATPYGRKREEVEVYILPGTLVDDDKILPEAKLIPYKNMYVGKLTTLTEALEDIIKSVGKVNFKLLKKETKELCSGRNLKTELSRMYSNKKISDYKRSIEWIYDEKEDKRTKYKRGISYNYKNI